MLKIISTLKMSGLYTFLYEEMQSAFLECSVEEKESYQPHLERLLSLFKSSVKEATKLKQIIPNSLVGDIRALMLETAKKEVAIIEERKPITKSEE